MTDLFPYQPSQAHRDRLIASGFDPDDPNRRYPTRNPEAERLFQTSRQHQRQPSRADLLQRGRGLIGRMLQRSAVVAIGIGCSADRAMAASDAWDRPVLIIGVAEFGLMVQILSFLALMVLIGVTLDLQGVLKAHLREVRRQRIRPDWRGLVADTLAVRRDQDHGVRPVAVGSGRDGESGEAIINEDSTQENAPPPGARHSVERPMTILLDCATRTGKVRKENQDAVGMDRIGKDSAYMVVCDGVGGRPGGREAAHLAVDVIARHLETTDTLSAKICEAAIETARREFQRERTQGLTTAIVAIIKNEWIHYATLGDGALTLIHPGGAVQELLAAHHQIDTPPNLITGFVGVERQGEARIGSVRVEPGSLLMAMSDGAGDLLPIEDVARNRDSILTALRDAGSDVAERFLLDLEEARDETGAYLHSDNMTLAITGIVAADSDEKETTDA